MISTNLNNKVQNKEGKKSWEAWQNQVHPPGHILQNFNPSCLTFVVSVETRV